MEDTSNKNIHTFQGKGSAELWKAFESFTEQTKWDKRKTILAGVILMMGAPEHFREAAAFIANREGDIDWLDMYSELREKAAEMKAKRTERNKDEDWAHPPPRQPGQRTGT